MGDSWWPRVSHLCALVLVEVAWANVWCVCALGDSSGFGNHVGGRTLYPGFPGADIR